MATAKCREKLTELLTFIKADVMEEQAGIVLNMEAWRGAYDSQRGTERCAKESG